MKALKLGAIFAFLVAGIILILNWDSLFGDNKVDPDFIDEDVLDISEECDKISSAWARVAEWDQDLYDAQCADVKQSKEMKLFSSEGYETVKSRIREEATNKACESYMAVLHQTENFSDARLQKAYQGVQAVKAAEGLKADSRIKKVEGTHSLYTDIKKFNHRPTITPNFDKKTASWKSFASIRSSYVDKAKAFKKNQYYGEVENVPGFKNKLDVSALETHIDGQRSGFYRKLSSLIIAYYEERPKTQDNKNALNQHMRNFNYEVGGNQSLTEDLADYFVNYNVEQ